MCTAVPSLTLSQTGKPKAGVKGRKEVKKGGEHSEGRKRKRGQRQGGEEEGTGGKMEDQPMEEEEEDIVRDFQFSSSESETD